MKTNSTKPTIKELINTMPQVGEVTWIGIRTEKKVAVQEVQSAELNPTTGIVNDHYAGSNGKRQVTLIQAEHLVVIGNILGTNKAVDPKLTRRNIVVKGINLFALKEQQVQIGEVILEITGTCPPCSRMEENLGPGGYNAMRGHGGVTARVLQKGNISLNDKVRLISST